MTSCWLIGHKWGEAEWKREHPNSGIKAQALKCARCPALFFEFRRETGGVILRQTFIAVTEVERLTMRENYPWLFR